MTSEVRSIDATALKKALHDGKEIALLDAREELTFGKRHLLMASCLPLGRIEVLADDMVPRRQARVVWCDDGEGLAERAARRMADLGYSDVSVLDGGIAAWAQAGYRIYSGVHVPSKAFAEVVEHDLETPWITAPELKELIDTGADIALFDSRSFEEYHTNSIPTAVSVPGAELVYRFNELVNSPDTTVIVNCGGRTRSIIGAQALINAGIPNKVVSLKDGTMAWHLSGFEVVQGAGKRGPEMSAASEAATEAANVVAKRMGIERIGGTTLAAWQTERERVSLYILDVRTPEEYETEHVSGMRSAPGGQLVQETDNFLATWGARVVLADSDGVRAVMTASWLNQMGWENVAVIRLEEMEGDHISGPYSPAALGLQNANAETIDAAVLKERLGGGAITIIDLEYSKQYRKGHIPGAWFSTRTRLADALAKVPESDTIVLTSPNGDLARIAASELVGNLTQRNILALRGGTRAWAAVGFPLDVNDGRLADTLDDVWLPAREQNGDRESAMRAYLAWEIDLVNQMATDDDQRFQVARLV